MGRIRGGQNLVYLILREEESEEEEEEVKKRLRVLGYLE